MFYVPGNAFPDCSEADQNERSLFRNRRQKWNFCEFMP